MEGSYTLPIIRHFLNPELVHVAIPVIYNICMDYGEKNPPVSKTMAINDEDIEPAHAQMAENRTAYIILKLLKMVPLRIMVLCSASLMTWWSWPQNKVRHEQ